ncbi:MAG: hypothetical protein GFH27_549287n170 [Chloroflexi bacterium AL-W]|nr:hypothetical protein [Chloroflexi bacterium AL-N1]NOK66444.1 hypothetical protein [Chloroflexi bacterium AL-N10]NOK71832.1 hypothetical protein [Chloroflexi bacterium AL-N5]NOK81089.1 hypothetical protein [Chloroflexi bacterium AL-W]NOK89362.1 hypothetical protein [Chloroflexi bacterium AL-N15]
MNFHRWYVSFAVLIVVIGVGATACQSVPEPQVTTMEEYASENAVYDSDIPPVDEIEAYDDDAIPVDENVASDSDAIPVDKNVAYDDDAIPVDEIEAFVAEEMAQIEQATFSIDGENMPMVSSGVEDNTLTLDFAGGLVEFAFNEEVESATVEATVLYGQIAGGVFDVVDEFYGEVDINWEDEGWQVVGTVESDDGDTRDLDLLFNNAFLGAGTTKLVVDDTQAVLTGLLGTRSYTQMQEMIEQHPEVETLVLQDVPGSINDTINVHTGRLVRNAGLDTYVPANGLTASGGTDLLLAGVERIVEEGATIGVHTWCCEDDLQAWELPDDHPAHNDLITYSNEMLGSDIGRDFYFYTIKAATFDEMHNMSSEELLMFNVATDILSAAEVGGIP